MLSSILTAATGTYFFVLPNVFPMQKKCLGFLFTNYFVCYVICYFASVTRQFQEIYHAGSRSREEEEMARKLASRDPTYLARISIMANDMLNGGALQNFPVTVLLLLVASTNASDLTMQMLALAPFIQPLINQACLFVGMNGHRGIMISGCIRMISAIVSIGASVSMIKSEFF